MIIMINGAFGAGKTTVSKALVEKIPNSMIYDPEEVGILLRNIIPNEVMGQPEKTGDFQDFQLWPKLVVIIAEQIKEQYNRHLIVPMTLSNIEYFKYIYTGLGNIDSEIYHFCLKASLTTTHERLKKRGDQPGGWPFLQTEKCINAYEKYDFSEYIDTENLKIKEIVNIIVRKTLGDAD
ncbi:AAA family ATPase [Clostridium sp. CS001]|uniref:AAA family ATPase n=1 Tax=Clostridium sp. CS001 TaxID=2880648 RepID=UPI001CF18323|nr:AAA family ATPase [Clostridium sp. CS001]MCB2290916.1 AAA family ATPase [Clostridium sp. CS001]